MNKQNNCDINRNIRFFINLYLYLYLFKVQFNKATSKTWTRTLKNLDPEKHGSWKAWNNMGLKNMSDFTELCFNKISISTQKYNVPTILIE